MPVHDHPIHEKTVFGDDFRYGCHSKHCPPIKSPGYWVKQREYKPDGKFIMVDSFILHNLSALCRYDKREGDDGCRECTNESDTKYLEGYGL
jgi:hypothetical protein